MEQFEDRLLVVAIVINEGQLTIDSMMSADGYGKHAHLDGACSMKLAR